MNLQLPKVIKKFIYIRNTNILKEDVGNGAYFQNTTVSGSLTWKVPTILLFFSPAFHILIFRNTQHYQVVQPSVCALHITEHTP